MNESIKYYNKAMKKFKAGNINKALEYCEEAVALDINNNLALNLKGMILYLKGNLNGAQASWKVNANLNNDETAKSYLANSKKDLKREVLYARALREIKIFNLDEAVEFLEVARESDFNVINVYNALAYCYIKFGYIDKAKEAIEKVLSVEKGNKVANDYLSELNLKNRGYKNVINKKIALAGSVAIGLVVISGTILLSDSVNFKNKVSNNKKNQIVVKEEEKEQDSTNNQEYKDENKQDDKKNEEVVLKNEEYDLKSLIDKNDYEGLFEVLEKDRDIISVDSQKSYEVARELLELGGVKYFYDKGLNEFKNGEFGKANKEFQKGFKYAKDSYLEEHLNYMIAVNYEKLKDLQSAIKFYSDYESNFIDGEYLEEVLYKLSLLNKDKDISTSKKYAEKLAYKFKNSIYNNNNIKDILESE